jgi:shikimate dehydrogenase
VADIAFVGVSTAASLVHRAFPVWMSLLDTRCGLRGVDIPLGADDGVYVDWLDELSHDSSLLGAVVTTHKVRLFQAAHSRFDWLDPIAVACQEVNSIRRNPDGSLEGWARDPVSVGRVIDQIWPGTEGQVTCLGAGGTGTALAYHLSTSRPLVRLVCADPDAAASDRLAGVAGTSIDGRLGRGPWDDLVASSPPGSLIVNATGLGKDRPGSPTTDAVRFPPGATVWELNYRGDLRFLDQARQQAPALRGVHDGWQLFCHGWAAALTVVLDHGDDETLGDRLVLAAREIRPTRP